MLGLVLGVYTFAWSGESKLVWTLGPNRVQGQSIIKKNKQRLLYRKALKWISWKTRVDENAYGDTEFGHNLHPIFACSGVHGYASSSCLFWLVGVIASASEWHHGHHRVLDHSTLSFWLVCITSGSRYSVACTSPISRFNCNQRVAITTGAASRMSLRYCASASIFDSDAYKQEQKLNRK